MALYRYLQLIALALFLGAAGLANAQTFRVQLSGGDTVLQGQALQLTYAFEDVRPRGFALPEMVGLRVVGGPNRSSQTRIANGKRSSSLVLTYFVLPDQVGLGYIPAVEVKSGDDTLVSSEIQVFITDNPDYVPLDKQASPEAPKAPRPPTVRMR